MEHRKGLFLVGVEARRLGGDDEDQLAAVARLVLGCGGGRRSERREDGEAGQDPQCQDPRCQDPR